MQWSGEVKSQMSKMNKTVMRGLNVAAARTPLRRHQLQRLDYIDTTHRVRGVHVYDQ